MSDSRVKRGRDSARFNWRDGMIFGGLGIRISRIVFLPGDSFLPVLDLYIIPRRYQRGDADPHNGVFAFSVREERGRIFPKRGSEN
jgi:hypothetical protein